MESETFTHFPLKSGPNKAGCQEIGKGFSGETDQSKRRGMWKPPAGGSPRGMIQPDLPMSSKRSTQAYGPSNQLLRTSLRLPAKDHQAFEETLQHQRGQNKHQPKKEVRETRNNAERKRNKERRKIINILK